MAIIDPQIKKQLALASVSTEVMAKMFFPEVFEMPFNDAVHREILKRIDSDKRKVGIAAPRGWGKTSIVSLPFLARYILFRRTKFIVYISKSHDMASQHTEDLRRELLSNKAVRQLFGSIKTSDAKIEGMDESFSRKAWVALDTLVLPRGAGQQVRGVLFKYNRPGLIVIDDLEDPDTINNEEQRKKLKEWFHADVEKATSRYLKNWKIVYIDTLKHYDSLLQEILDSSEWDSTRLEACDDNYKSVAPEFMSDEDIQAELDYHREEGILDVFYREYRNLPVATENASFKQEYFRRYNVAGKRTKNDSSLSEWDLQNDPEIENIVIVDPAKTVNLQSADSAILGIGLDLNLDRAKNNQAGIYVREIISDKLYPDELYSEMFGMAARLSAKVLGVEETSLNEFIKQPIYNWMTQSGVFYEIVWLKPRGGDKKELRIKALVPYYRRGQIYHNAACCNKLEGQLLTFPKSKLWDAMDCLAYVIYMMEVGQRYFILQDNNTEPTPDDEYLELMREPALQNDWQIGGVYG